MKQDLPHLPEGNRRKLEFVVRVIREASTKTVAHRTQPRFRTGKLLKNMKFDQRELVNGPTRACDYKEHKKWRANSTGWQST